MIRHALKMLAFRLVSSRRSKVMNREKHRILVFEPLHMRAVLAAIYIDPVNGDDTSSGFTEQMAWKSTVNIATRYEGADAAPKSYHLQPGDFVNFIAGSDSAATYYSGDGFGYQFLFLRGIHGTAEQPITIRGIDLPSITSVAPNGTEMSMVYVLQSSYIVIEDLEFVGGYGSAITIAESNHVSVEDLSIRDIDGIANNNLAGVHVVGSSEIEIAGSIIIDVYDRALPGNQNNRPIVVFGSSNVSILNNTLGYSELGLGFGVEFKHLGSLSAAQAGRGQFHVSGNVIVKAKEFGITSAAPNSLIENNLLIDCSIRLADIGGTAQLSNERVINNTIVNTQQNARTGSLYYAPTEYAGYPLGRVEFVGNLIVDKREYLTSETNTLEVDRYGNDENYQKSIGAGLFHADRNVYSALDTPRFDVFGSAYSAAGGDYSFAQWQSLGYDRSGILANLALDEFFAPDTDVQAGWYAGDATGLAILPVERSIAEDGTQRMRLTRRGMDTSAPLTVAIQSSAPERLSVPRQVTIPAGSAWAEFSATGVPNQSTGDDRAVQIKVSATNIDAVTWLDLVDALPPVGSKTGVFLIPGLANGKTQISSIVTVQNGEYRSELGYAIVDNEFGSVNGLLPSSDDWLRELLSDNRARTIIAAGTELGSSTTTQAPSGEFVIFYFVQNSTLDEWQESNPTNSLNSKPVLFTSIASANPDRFDHLRENIGNHWTLAWEDLVAGGDQNFTDLVVELSFATTPLEALVNYSFQFTNENGDLLQQVCVGERFFVDVHASDLRQIPEGVFSAALDVQYTSRVAQALTPILYSPELPNYHTGSSEEGQINELGAVASLTPRGTASLVARIPMQALAAGSLTVTGNAADIVPAHQTTLIGMENSVSINAIRYSSSELIVLADRHWHNSPFPEDVDGDGVVSPIDALNVINFLNSHGTQSNLYAASVDALFAERRIDVNNDGTLSPIDALLVINRLNGSLQSGV